MSSPYTMLRMIEYKPEHIIGSMFEIRHPEMCDVINSHLENHSWFSVIIALKRCRASEAIVPGWDIHLREGTLRHGLMTYLGLEDFVGLDVDFLTAFAERKVRFPNPILPRLHLR
ncbi:MAG: hypothetical protein ACW99G_21305 [Candidatus Thorarchaeota archaeon]